MKKLIKAGSQVPKAIKGTSTKFNFELKQPWSKRYYTNEFSLGAYGDGRSHPVSTCKFSNGMSAVVFYDEYSYIVFDQNGKYLDSNCCDSTREAKREATAVAFDEYQDYVDSGINATTASSINRPGEHMKKLIKASAQSNAATRYDNYEVFVRTCYPEFNIGEEDMAEEIAAVEDHLVDYNANPKNCPVFWRADYEEPIIQIDGQFYFVNLRGMGSGLAARFTPLDSPVFDDIVPTFGLPIEQCDAVMSSDEPQYPKGYFDDYFGQTAYEEYGDLVADECAGMIISKRADDGEEPGGLIYEAERLGIEDFFDLLRCLEGMCYNGKAVEISDYQYMVR